MNLNYESGKVGDYKGNPVYVFGRTEAQKEEDWLVELKKASQARIKKEKKTKSAVSSPELTNFKAVRVEDLTTLSAGIDAYIKEQLNRDWLSQS